MKRALLLVLWVSGRVSAPSVDCLTRDDCERAACRWNQSNEAMWCTAR